MARGGLGGGLGSLFENNSSEVQMKKTLRISELEPNRNQPRKNFDNTSITALAESIKEHGVLQPILVRPLPLGNYQIVAGERRWRAAKMVGLDEVPVIIRELSELETAQIALIENLQRENLNPIEEAQAYKKLIEEFHLKQ
ncbi:MAG: ParB/RepB/Spo0J family partition protein, partial [Oscillospiraceae bacterium]|nr:ParB/RepB/Spo0J family partition protein [Oscillospiraceae bacterium]